MGNEKKELPELTKRGIKNYLESSLFPAIRYALNLPHNSVTTAGTSPWSGGMSGTIGIFLRIILLIRILVSGLYAAGLILMLFVSYKSNDASAVNDVRGIPAII